jgi:hypothetical protein
MFTVASLAMEILNSLWLLALLCTAIVESNSALPQCTYPSLLDATQIELQTGLRLGCFTSVDLVMVSLLASFLHFSRY